MTEKQYFPLFNIPIVKEKTLQVDLNYYGIRQKLKNFGIDTFKIVKENKSVKEVSSFDFKQYWQDMNNCVLDFYKWVEDYLNGNKKENF